MPNAKRKQKIPELNHLLATFRPHIAFILETACSINRPPYTFHDLYNITGNHSAETDPNLCLGRGIAIIRLNPTYIPTNSARTLDDNRENLSPKSFRAFIDRISC
jgi:hypothetical protein